MAAQLVAQCAAIHPFYLNLDEWQHSWQHSVPPFVHYSKSGRIAAQLAAQSTLKKCGAANCAAICPDLNEMDEWRHVWQHIFSDWQHLIFKVLCAANCAAIRPDF